MAEKCCFQNATTSQNPKLFHKNHERRFPSRSSESLVRCQGSGKSVILWLNAGARPTDLPSRCSSGRLPTKLPARRAGSGRSQRHLQRCNLHRVQRQTRISFLKFDLFSLLSLLYGSAGWLIDQPFWNWIWNPMRNIAKKRKMQDWVNEYPKNVKDNAKVRTWRAHPYTSV